MADPTTLSGAEADQLAALQAEEVEQTHALITDPILYDPTFAS